MPFDENHAHLHCCSALKYGTTVRHNMVLSAAAKFCRMCGATTREEPASLVRRQLAERIADDNADDYAEADGDVDAQPADGRAPSADATLAQPGASYGWLPGDGLLHQVARRADLLVACADFFGYADVSVAHPATATLLRNRQPEVTERTLVAAGLREKSKQELYSKCPEYAPYDMQPIVLETFGGIGAKAAAFVRRMASAGCSERPLHMADRGLDMLAVALVKGNAALEQMGIPAALRAAHARGGFVRRHDPAPQRGTAA